MSDIKNPGKRRSIKHSQTKLVTEKIQADDGRIIEFTGSSGNVFADLDLPDADELFWKSALVAEISKIIEAKGLTQMEVSRLSGLHQAEVSRLLNGKLSSFSVERILRVLNRLGHSVELRISREEKPDASTVVLIA